ncbi:hypothetical protein DUNSADRAFT_13965 [Dunaliella salina]|uniref:Encoded protein n=1 Tax=Dunaliella salina TaxID=3046 RepID=A0ABQ7G8B2_DUNSA|nr:hypothetical protein DUNSADRAFT_13965 [Dunaliella salina]|eukprot:KAF5830842.1 hypothetical protein DUNSADRAFT_13965 [Dunaliella salina]
MAVSFSGAAVALCFLLSATAGATDNSGGHGVLARKLLQVAAPAPPTSGNGNGVENGPGNGAANGVGNGTGNGAANSVGNGAANGVEKGNGNVTQTGGAGIEGDGGVRAAATQVLLSQLQCDGPCQSLNDAFQTFDVAVTGQTLGSSQVG